MRGDVVQAIASAKDVTNAIILTHNIDFVFLQTVVLSAFRKCGHPTITVFADAVCAGESYASQAPVLDGLGVRYRVVPIAMSPGYRFHPKAVVLSGEKDATLFVGSGNLTFGGWRENAEVWTRFDASSEGASVFVEFRQYLHELLRLVPLGDAIATELAEAFDPATRGWWADPQPTAIPRLVGRTGVGRSLLDRMVTLRGDRPVEELLVCAPYFDAEGAALRAVIDAIEPARTTVLCQPTHSTLTQEAFTASASRARLEHVTFTHESGDGRSRTAFIHAKVYVLRHGGAEALAFAGSANCSRAALLAGGTSGNAELMAVRTLPVAELESSLLGEFVRLPEPVVLAEREPSGIETTEGGHLRVLAARLDANCLRVGFTPRGATVRVCEIDGAAVQFVVSEPGILTATCVSEPQAVRVQGSVDGVEAWSPATWIDHERHLRASARGRGLADSIRARVRQGSWNAAGWADVMDVFCKHLSYMPVREGAHAASTPEGHVPDSGTFSYADVFSTSYKAPALGGLEALVMKLDGGKERSLQQLLLRWFGLTDDRSVEASNDAIVATDDDTEQVDRPEALPVKRTPPPPVTDADRRRVARVLEHVEAAMTNPLFLSVRQPEQLAADLKLAAVLLRAGLREGWLDAAAFFRTTHRVWTPLFFTGSPEASQGWLEYRQHTVEDEAAFVSALRSPDLTAALLGWALAVPPSDPTPASARFQLAVALAVGRLPWLWDIGDDNAVANELEALLAITGLAGVTAETVRSGWARTLKRGHALVRLEREAARFTPEDLRGRIHSPTVSAGALLWQGAAGYCVVMRTTPRVDRENVLVLRLQSQQEVSKFRATFTMPVDALLSDKVIPLSPSFDREPRQVLTELLGEIRGSLAATASAAPK